MPPVLSIVNQVFVKKFYERHAGLLFLIFYAMFGMVEPGQIISYHLGLIYATLESPVFLLIVFAIWVLYSIKGVLFFEECLALPQNTFVRQIALLSRAHQFILICYAFVFVNLPVLAYSAVIISVAIKNQNLVSAFTIVAFHLVLICASAYRTMYSINSSTVSIVKIPAFRFPFIKSFPIFYHALLADRFKITLGLAKAASIICVIGFLQIPVDEYEPRLAYLGLVTGVIFHSVIIFEWRKFEDHYLLFTRGLPLHLIYRFGILALAYLLLFLPEFVVLLTHHVLLWNALTAILLAIGFCLFAHCRLLKGALNNDGHIRIVFGLYLITFFLALSKLALLTGLLLMIISGWRFVTKFDKYEPAANISS